MNKSDIKTFFNNIAYAWDEDSVYKEDIISEILNKADVSEGKKVLDVACGTGFLFKDYYLRNVSAVTGIDISENMLEICSEKFSEAKLICGDAEEYNFEEFYDVVVIHNAFPHFCNSEKLFSNLTKYLSSGGRLTVSHDMSREELNSYHGEKAIDVSKLLPEAEKLKKMLSRYLEVDIIIDDDRMYLVSGIKK